MDIIKEIIAVVKQIPNIFQSIGAIQSPPQSSSTPTVPKIANKPVIKKNI